MFNLLGLLGGKGKMIGVLVLLLAVAGGAAYHFWTVNSLQKELTVTKQDLETSKANEQKLQTALDTSEQSISLLENQREIDQQKLDRLSKEMSKSRDYVNDLRRKLSDHDLGYLILRKPDWLENIINNGTREVGQAFETLSAPEEETDVQ